LVFAVGTWEVFAASAATLKESHFCAQNFGEGAHQFLDVVAVLNRENPSLAVVIQPQIHKLDEFFPFNPRQLESSWI
jgi:hypothetical protein